MIEKEVSLSHCNHVDDESSESDDGTEPAREFNRRLSTNKEMKHTVTQYNVKGSV